MSKVRNESKPAGPVDRPGLFQRRVAALQPGEIQNHDVSGLPPDRGDEDRR
jgi:hypothetical protein